MPDPETSPPERQPIFNLPDIVVLLIAILVGIHVVREYLLSPDIDFEILLAFAFIPARITDAGQLTIALPGGEAATIWSFLTYALLHADWGHVAINCLWLAAFGSPLARRFGPRRFLLFSAAGAIGGALLHLAVHAEAMAPLVGASAAISAHMAAASRFVLTSGGPLRGGPGPEAYRRPAQPLAAIIRDSRVIMFVAVWFGLNFVFGLVGESSGLTSGAIAWEAHVGGFLVGLLLFPLFDPIAVASPIDRA
jgi:membrane associated rhomboid family serine protease